MLYVNHSEQIPSIENAKAMKRCDIGYSRAYLSESLD